MAYEGSAEQPCKHVAEIEALKAEAERLRASLFAYRAMIVIHPHDWLAVSEGDPVAKPTTEGLHEILDRLQQAEARERRLREALETAGDLIEVWGLEPADSVALLLTAVRALLTPPAPRKPGYERS